MLYNRKRPSRPEGLSPTAPSADPRDELLERLQANLARRNDLLAQILLAVGRVGVFNGVPTSSIEGLPRLVALLASDHDDLDGRLTAVVDYVRSLPEAVRYMPEIQKIGQLIQGADPEVIDLR